MKRKLLPGRYSHSRRGLVVLVVLMALVTGILSSEAVRANGVGTEIWKDSVGPYAISVGVDPHPPVPGAIRLNVSVTEQATDGSVPSATVSVVGVSQTNNESAFVEFGSLPFELPDYHGSFVASHTGEWQLDFKVTSDIGDIQFRVPLAVVDEDENDNNGFPIVELFAVLGLGAVVVAGIVWLMK